MQSSKRNTNKESLEHLRMQIRKAERKSKKVGDMFSEQDQLADHFSSFIDLLARKRIDNLIYLLKLHEGKVLWLDVVQILKHDYQWLYSNFKHSERAKDFFFMGMSLGVVLNLPDGDQFVRAMAQLTEEFRYHCKNSSFSPLKMFRSVNKTAVAGAAASQPVVAEVMFSGSQPNYKYLLTPALNIPMDYTEVVMGLLTVLLRVYRKFAHPSCSEVNLMEAINRIDQRVMANIVDYIIHDMEKISSAVIKHTIKAFKPPKRLQVVDGIEDSESDDSDADHIFGTSQKFDPFLPMTTMLMGDVTTSDLAATTIATTDNEDFDDDDERYNSDDEATTFDLSTLESPDIVSAKLVELQAELDKEQVKFQSFDVMCGGTARMVQDLSKRLHAQAKVLSIYHEQQKMHERFAAEVISDPSITLADRSELEESMQLLDSRVADARSEKERLEREFATLTEEYKNLNKQRNDIKPQLMQLIKRVELTEKMLCSCEDFLGLGDVMLDHSPGDE